MHRDLGDRVAVEGRPPMRRGRRHVGQRRLEIRSVSRAAAESFFQYPRTLHDHPLASSVRVPSAFRWLMVGTRGPEILGKIATDLELALAGRRAAGDPARMAERVLARGIGWSVADVLCTAGPSDRAFEEQHEVVSIAIVTAGSFQYRSPAGRALLTPGSVLLGNPGQAFECGHDHAAGDRCVAFRYTSEYFEGIVGAVASTGRLDLPVARLPPLRELAGLVASGISASLGGGTTGSWEELGVQLAVASYRAASREPRGGSTGPAGAEARVTRVIRMLERDRTGGGGLSQMAETAGLSPYHFLRTFQRLTGSTPHQYLMRQRLRHAAVRLATEPARVIDIALGSGFGDLSNFNRAFRTEFGAAPLGYRRQVGGPGRARPSPKPTRR